ncbi:MAG: hypothetical protein N2482_03195 [Patescibacteria group bacterium]|nr:hypothetical protein [Patescibacteria group bacterium]
MRVVRKLKKGLIFTLAFIADIYQDFSIKNYYRVLYWPGGYPYKRESLTGLVSRMTKLKEIEKIRKDGEVFLKLTSKGGAFFNEKISLKKLSEKEWDGLWRVVIFDIKEIEKHLRDKLRRKLKSWGFALWQESVYISPHPILKEVDEFLKIKKFFPKVVTMEARLVGIKNHDKFAWVVFKLSDLKDQYLSLKNKIKKLKERKKYLEKEVKEILEEFQELILKDPFLPRGLIEKDWPRERIKKELKDLLRNL